jgi:hypothetical protein
MSSLRKHFKVSWNNGPLVDIVTNARDMAAAGEYVDDPGMGTWAMIYSCLERYGHDVPDFETFVDQLDELTPDNEKPQVESMDPTVGVAISQLPSRSA